MMYRCWFREALRAGLVALLLLRTAATAAQAESETGSEARSGELVPPELVESVEAPFPAGALEAEVEADVVLQIDVGADGAVSNIVPIELIYFTWSESGEAIEEARAVTDDPWGFVGAAVQAVAAYRFAPARLIGPEGGEGEATPVQLTWRLGFVAETVETPVSPPEEASDDASVVEGSGAEPAQDLAEAPVNLAGRVLERGTRVPLAGVLVRAAPLASSDAAEGSGEAQGGQDAVLETVTDLDGTFALSGLAEGTWRISLRATGYFDADSDEEIVEGERTSITYYVERNSYGDYVSRTTTTRPRREVTRTTLQVSEIQRIPGNNNDAIRVVQNLPGVARAAFGGGEVIIRGSAPEDTGFYIDGMQIPAIYHFGGLRAVFPTELIESINFYPGGHSAQFGRATGGIVSVETNRELPEQFGGHVDINVFDTGVWAELPIGERTVIRAGGRRSYIDALLVPVADAIGLNFATAPRYYDFQLDVTHRFNNQHRLSLLLYGSDDLIDLVRDDQSGLDPDQRGGIRARLYFNGALLRLDSQFTDTLRNEFRAQAYYQGLGFRLGDALYFDLNTAVHQYRDTFEWRPSDRYALRYGMDISVQPGRIRLRAPRPPKEGEEPVGLDAAEVLEAEQEVRIYTPAHFIEAELEPVEGLRFVPGARMEYFRPPERWGIDPRLAIRWQAHERAVVKGAVGVFHQSPQPDEWSDSYGNPNLQLERAVHYVLGTEIRVLDFLEANVELFYKDLDQLVSRSDATVERGGETVPEIYSNGGRGRIYGAEILVRHNPVGRFFGWIAYTISRSERLDAGAEEWRLFDFDQTHILTMLGSYSLPRNWSIGARFRLVSGNPVTPIVGSVYDAGSDTYVRVAGEPNSARAKTFHQLDIRVDKRWIFDRWTMNLYLDVQNVYNRMNQEGELYSYDFSERADLTGLPLIPSLGLRAEF